MFTKVRREPNGKVLKKVYQRTLKRHDHTIEVNVTKRISIMGDKDLPATFESNNDFLAEYCVFLHKLGQIVETTSFQTVSWYENACHL
jgi:hypothetical protein